MGAFRENLAGPSHFQFSDKALPDAPENHSADLSEPLWSDPTAMPFAREHSPPSHLFFRAKTYATRRSTLPDVFAFPLRTLSEPCSVHSPAGGFSEGTLRNRFDSSFQNSRIGIKNDEF